MFNGIHKELPNNSFNSDWSFRSGATFAASKPTG